jgi:putative aldouronate transport system permease protein
MAGKRKKGLKARHFGDKCFYILNALCLGILALIVIYPLYFVVIASISDPDAVLADR